MQITLVKCLTIFKAKGIAVDKHATYKNETFDGKNSDSSDGGRRHRDSKTLDYLITILGFGLCFAWIVFSISEPISADNNHMLNWVYLGSGAVAALSSAFLAGGSRRIHTREHTYIYRTTGILAVVSSIILPIALSLDNEPLTLIGFVTGGAGAGLLQVLWGEQLTKHEVHFAQFVSPAASIVTGAFVALSLTELSEGINMFGYVAFPLISVGLLLLKADRSDLSIKRVLGKRDADSETRAISDIPPVSSSATVAGKKSLDAWIFKLMVSVMLFSLLCRMFDVLIYDYTDPFAFFGDSSLFALAVVGISFLLLAALLKDRFNLALTYRLALPIMVAGFVAIALFSQTQAALSVLLINIGYNFFDILIWILLADIAIRRGLQPFKVFGPGVTFMFMGMALGYLAGDVINSCIEHGELQITVVAMVCVLSLVVVAFLVIPEGSISGVLHGSHPSGGGIGSANVEKRGSDSAQEMSVEAEKKAAATADVKHRLDANCEAVAATYGLTPREREVLMLLACGRTLSIIARDLTIATGTARSHMEKIYRKLGVHKQQELIDLVEGFDIK